MKKNQTLATALMLASTTGFCLMQVFVRMSGTRIGTMQQVFFRNAVSFLIAFCSIIRAGVPVTVRPGVRWLVFIRSLFGFLAVVVLFYAFNNGRQADVTTLSRTSAFFTTLFSALFLKEKISKVQIPALLLCFCGAVIAFCPKFGDGISPALLCAVLDAVFSGVAYTTLSVLGGKAHPLTVVFYFSAFSCLSAGFLMIPQYVQPTANELYLLVLIGVTAAVGQIGLTYACQLSSAAQMSIYSYVSIPVSMLFGLLFFQEKITVKSVIGGALVIISALWQYGSKRKGQ